ncbi:MAG: secretin N-terminal domain-containing protein [Methylotenera sp.]
MKITRRFLWLPSCLLTLYCLLFSAQTMAATVFKIITLQHCLAEGILPAIQPLAGGNGTITGIQNQLIIRVSPEKMAEIEQVIATLDVARRNLKITVRSQSDLQTERNGVAVTGLKRIGNVEIGTSHITNRLPNSAKDGVQIAIGNNQSNARSSSNQYVNVIDGERAFIRVGQSVPFTQEWVTLTRRYSSLQQTTEFVDISTGFAVRPRSIGNSGESEVELEITPRIAHFNSQPNQSGYIDFEELTTVVLVNRGEWLDLGAVMLQKDDVSRTILNKMTGNQSQSSQLSIRVE